MTFADPRQGVQGSLDILHAFPHGGGRHFGHEALRLREGCGNRGAQLVCAIGSEATLRSQRALQASHQVIDRVGNRSDLRRQFLLFERCQVVLAACSDAAAETPDWP